VEVSKDVCEERHKKVDAMIAHHESWLGEHETKIDKLECSDAQKTTEIKNLVSSLGGLTKALWGLALAIGVALFGFLVWYIQSLPR
jgi:hypothetical protein